MSLPSTLSEGTLLGGHYLVGPLINRGGFGAVYRGVDTSEGDRPCAIKETYDVTPAARRQALMEASILFTVRSKHLPEVYDAFQVQNRFYLVMQLIEGRNLLEVLRSRIGSRVLGEQQPHEQWSGPCSEQEVLAWLLPIMDVLQELHSRKPAIIHRDIKPANIILTPGQTPVLVDFGLTRLYDPKSTTQTMVRAVSEGFSPLEQYIGKTNPQSDIYSMAATMYLLLTNRLPPAAMKRSMNDTLLEPHLFNPVLSLPVERALLKALSIQADQRYASMQEFALALQEPAFNAHADPTIAVAPVQAVPTPQPTPRQAPPLRRYTGVSQPVHNGARVQTPPAPPSPPVSPYAPMQMQAAPPGLMMVPQTVQTPVRTLPSAFGQGCLWGLLQGVLAAVMVLLLMRDEYFYLAILMGFAFFVIAGFMTTWQGGATIRGAWAGCWAGITSTAMFWIVLGIGLVLRFAIRLQEDTALLRGRGLRVPADLGSRAWRAVLPDFLTHPPVQQQQSATTLLIILGGGLLIAFCLGWIGGILGKSWRTTTSATKRTYP
jgi:serine/threonine protein kinase